MWRKTFARRGARIYNRSGEPVFALPEQSSAAILKLQLRTKENPMSGTKRVLVTAMFFIAPMFAPAPSRAQSPFDGTWRVDLAHTRFSPKPLSFYIARGWYHCEESCNPPIVIAADAIDHPVSGHSYSSMSVTIIDPHTIYVIARKAGKIIFEQTLTASTDRKTLTVKSTEYPCTATRRRLTKRL